MTFKELIYFLVDHDVSSETIKDFCYQYDTDTDKDKNETFFYLHEFENAFGRILKVYKCVKCGYAIIDKIDVDIWNYCPRCGRKITRKEKTKNGND